MPRVKDTDKRVVQNLQQISGKFDAMNAEFDPEKNKVEVVDLS